MIPVLLLKGAGLVKTVRFRRPVYVGDPINTLRIFNEKEVDEIVVLDIDATRKGQPPDVRKAQELAGECFMPLAYGGGITSVRQIAEILHAGAEKVVLNSALVSHPQTIVEAAHRFGSQSIVVSVDVRHRLLRGNRVFTHGGRRATGMDPVRAARVAVELGAGELLLNSIDRDGTYHGYDVELVRSVASAVPIPVVACGGARSVSDMLLVVQEGHASAAAAGSMFVFQGVHRAVLVNFPNVSVLDEQLFTPLGRELDV